MSKIGFYLVMKHFDPNKTGHNSFKVQEVFSKDSPRPKAMILKSPSDWEMEQSLSHFEVCPNECR